MCTRELSCGGQNNFIGGSSGFYCPNSDSKSSNFSVVVMLLLPFYRCVFHIASFSDKVSSASHDDVITPLGQDKRWLQAICGVLSLTMRPAVFFQDEVTVKSTALNSPLLLLRLSKWQIKNTTTTVSECKTSCNSLSAALS